MLKRVLSFLLATVMVMLAVPALPLLTSATVVSCGCDTVYAGTYVCQSDALSIRKDHSASAELLGTIPKNATVKVAMASGTGSGHWGHVEYNGIKGYASMAYLTKSIPLNTHKDIAWYWPAHGYSSATGHTIRSPARTAGGIATGNGHSTAAWTLAWEKELRFIRCRRAPFMR